MQHTKKSIRLYYPGNLVENEIILSNLADIHYLIKVMRLKEGHCFLLFNSSHGEFLVLIKSIKPKELILSKLQKTRDAFKELKINLIFSPIKQNRMIYLLEKATELGVTTLTPIITRHTITDKFNIDKWQIYVKEAAEQSNRLSVPEIKPLVKFDNFLKNWNEEHIYFCNETEKESSFIQTKKEYPMNILIGPEGGFSAPEIQILKDKNYIKSVSLGTLILRTETAALSALVIASQIQAY